MARSQRIAEREYALADGSGRVRIRLHRPEQDRRSGDWCCRVEIDGLPDVIEHHEGWGFDSLEAITAALQGLAAWMEPHRHRIRWRGNTFLGLPVYVPHGLGERIDMRLLAAVDREMQKVAAEMDRARLKAAKRNAVLGQPLVDPPTASPAPKRRVARGKAVASKRRRRG